MKRNRLDEDNQYEGRYQISVQQQGYQQALVVKSVGLQQQGKTEQVTDQSEIQRYNGMMINTLIEGTDKQDNPASSQTASRFGALDVQSGADDTGLPCWWCAARTPWWDRLPAALEKLGMKVVTAAVRRGTVAVTYKSLSSSDWDALGVKDPELAEGDYKLQVGDLNNRTSLQFIDPKGKPLTQSKTTHWWQHSSLPSVKPVKNKRGFCPFLSIRYRLRRRFGTIVSGTPKNSLGQFYTP